MNPTVRVGIGVFCFKDGKFIVGKRRGSHGDGTWSVPGGHLEFGESFAEAAMREMQEETGITIKNLRFGSITNDFFDKEQMHYITIWMIGEYESGTLAVLEPEKFTEVAWTDFDHIPEPVFHNWHNLRKSEFFDRIKNS